VRVIGGGSVSEVWNQIKADVLGIPYVRLKRTNTAALGVAILAGCASGLYSDMAETAAKFTSAEKSIHVNQEHHRRYKEYASLYTQLFGQLRSTYNRLADLSTEARSG
jgi:xylulokinase